MPQPRHAHARAFRDRPLPIGTADTRPRQTVNLVNFGAPDLTDTTTARPARPLAELKLRGILLGGIITLLFTAANVYLGLKVGLTFATSIPAAVISMAILRGIAKIGRAHD